MIPANTNPPVNDLSDEEIEFMVEHIEEFEPEERAEILAAAEALTARRQAAACRSQPALWRCLLPMCP
jgi:hypothetical protein